MPRVSAMSIFRLLPVLVAVAVAGPGCAAVQPVVAPMADVSFAPVFLPLLPPSARTADDFAALLERRPIEIPSGFVRVASPGDVTARREAAEFEYVARSVSCSDAWDIARTVGTESGIDPAIIFGVMRVESTFKVNVISYAGAVGLMQVMPASAAGLGCGDLLDPLENARCGAKILSRFMKRFDDRVILGLSAYNAGFGMPRRAQKKSGIPANFSYPENVLRVRAKFLRWGCAPWE